MTNLAYDFSRFDVAEKKQPEVEAKASQMQVVRPREKQGSAIKGVIFAIFVMAVCCSMLYTRVKINELSNAVSDESTTLSTLQAEGVQLQAKIDCNMSLENIEDYAVNVLGMKKIDTSQMQCIKVKTDDVIKSEKAENKGFFRAISNGIEDLVEYLGF